MNERTDLVEIFEKSGNSFHSRVVNLLRENGWTVLVSPYYSDNFTDKPREIDIIAEKKFDVNDHGTWIGTLNVQLFIECKYINGETIFWFDTKDNDRATKRIMRDTGMDEPEVNTTIKKHHYYSNTQVAKLFASGKSRNEDNEIISKAINQNLNATVYYRKHPLELIKVERGYIENVLKRVSYPLIVVNTFDNFHSTPMGGDEVITPITEPFELEVNYAYVDKERNNQNEYFLIDVVSLDKLTAFLLSIESTDLTIIKEKIIWDRIIGRRKN
jgi:hypothetical protein